MLASFGTGEVVASLAGLAFGVLWVGFAILVAADVIRSPRSGANKAAWVLLLVVAPILGAIVYLVVSGTPMHDRLVHAGDRDPAAPLGGDPDAERLRQQLLADAEPDLENDETRRP